jgi:hypothetical protein
MKNGIQTNNFNISKPETFTSQRIFDFVVARLAEQERPSLKEGYCAYRGQNSLKCAIGHLIPDELYNKLLKDGCDIDNDPSGEGVSISTLAKKKDLAYLQPFLGLLRDLQIAHDDARTVTELRYYLYKAANIHKLKSSLVGSIRNWKCEFFRF